MKIFAFIMAFLVLALSIMPCMDDNNEFKGNQKTAISKSNSQQEHSESDDCSPFCNCSCCSTSLIHQVPTLIYFQKPAFQEKNYSLHKPWFYSNISSSIWQPPKLA
jgi:hypothetical protein